MHRKRTLAMIAVCILFGASLAFAGYGYHHGGMMRSWDMGAVDANNDNQLTFEEYSAKQLAHLRAGFDMIDTDKDGMISEMEWKTLLEVHGVGKDS